MRRARATIALLALPAMIATACASGDAGGGGGGDGGEAAGPITFWTTNIEPERIDIQRQILSDFTEASGIEVELVPVAEDELASLMVANAASGELPEVVYHPIDYAIGWAEQGLLDVEAAAATLESLGRDTFNERALELATSEGEPVSVPSDAWGQLLVYRSDLFSEAGLEPPDTYDRIVAAAEALHQGPISGITAATDPADVFTQQTFEHFALANGCRLVDDAGTVALGSPECAQAIDTYDNLISNYSPGTVQTVDTTRATYFAGEAAMLLWSPFILDELAGLRNDALPNCDQCDDDPRFLAKNSAFVPAFSGPGGEPSQYGQISYWGIGTGTNTEAAQQLVEYLLGDGYLDWLSIAPEGQFPMRSGTAEEPEQFVEGWRELEIGVDEKAPLSEIYGDEVIDTLIAGTEQFDRWGFGQGYGALVSSVYESLIVPQALSEVLNGGLEPPAAAEQLQAEASEQLEETGGGNG